MAKIAHVDGIAMEDYMYSQYRDIQFELAYLSRIVKYLKPRIKNLKDQKAVYGNIIKNSVHPNLVFDEVEDEDIIDFSDKALDFIARIEDSWRKENLAEDYYDEKHPKVTIEEC